MSALEDSKSIILDENYATKGKETVLSSGKQWKMVNMDISASSNAPLFEGIDMAVMNTPETRKPTAVANQTSAKRGMVLPFRPLSLTFSHVNYYVDMPAEMKSQGIKETRLQMLWDVSGAFRPGTLTALAGVSGAGKTTFMDVLAGRKTGGYFEGSISISGYPKNQATFARVTGYCEQNDIHSPNVIVHESLMYSVCLHLPKDVNKETRQMFVEEIMDLVELNSLMNTLVGLLGLNGLSTEQRKRLTIAVELVANPLIIFMDEPTLGLDARTVAIIMRTVRNTVDTGRTVVCTILQPSMDIFEAFDELLLMKRGGLVIYAGLLGWRSSKLIEYFESSEDPRRILPRDMDARDLFHHLRGSTWGRFRRTIRQFRTIQEQSETHRRAEHAGPRKQRSLLPGEVLPVFPHAVQGLLLETALVLLEEPAVQHHPILHDDRGRSSVRVDLLE